MNKKKYIFINKLKQDWPKMINDLKNDYHAWQDSGKNFEVIVKKHEKLRGEKALRSYWMLLGVVEKWMKEQGNYFSKEELSDYFKFQVRHSKKIGETYVPKSIANNSGCTWLEMKQLLDYILQFGAENNIMGCEIKSDDLREMEKYYNINLK